MTSEEKAEAGPWEFDRYIDGEKMAEGGRIVNAASFEEAARKVVGLFRDRPKSVFVLRSGPSPKPEDKAAVEREEVARLIDPEAWEEYLLEDGRVDEEVASIFQDAYEASLTKADAILALLRGGRETTYTEFQLLTDPESHPILKAMLDLRMRAASSFTPEFSGQRFEDYDRALLACLEAARSVLISQISPNPQEVG